jgi:TRAP transporter TAXI family solute receptor
MTVFGRSNRKGFALLVASLCSLFVVGSADLVSAQNRPASYEDKKRQANDIAVNIVVSGLSCTCARFAEDMRNVLNDLRPDGLRILPVLGVGGLQNLNDVLFLKNIDMGVVDEDNVRFLKARDPRLYANIEQRVQYITKLYNSEFQVLARNDIKTYDDLRGKKVNFNLKDSQTEVSADFIFNKLGLDVVRSNYDNDEAIKMVKSGELAAMIILTGAPQASFAKLKAEDGVHFLALDKDQLPSHDLKPIFDYYLPADLTHEMYPALIPQGTSVSTVANRALLVAYSWPENSPRYKKLAKFVREFFGKIDQFHDSARHPKWKEVSLSAEIPGWNRFRPAADWLAEHRTLIAEHGQQRDFNAFLTTSDKPLPRSQVERDALFREFLQWRERQNARRQ